VPGGVAWVPLGIQSAIPPKIKYKQRRVLVLHHKQQWIALVGIPLSAKTGRHSVVNQETGKRYTFKVKAKKYKAQYIKLKNKRLVNPTSKDLKRIRRERKLMKAAFASRWRISSTQPLPLTQPVRGRLSSPFGLRRYFNGQARNPHTGLDIAVPQGTPIAAAASGKVVKTGHYFYTGKTVMIDHGQKVVTLYGHLNTIAVSVGQWVKRGQKIGTVGKTGRATGPHLHWSVSLNQTLIDPKLVMQWNESFFSANQNLELDLMNSGLEKDWR
jgi:murein DD-endopeptidase MepM/ murein hydrolase activator NlpD